MIVKKSATTENRSDSKSDPFDDEQAIPSPVTRDDFFLTQTGILANGASEFDVLGSVTKMKKHILLLVLCTPLLFASAVHAQKKDPQTVQRKDADGGQQCPPGGTLSTYHWDNGKGDDLTVDVVCVGNDAAAYVSTKITQSKKGKNTEVANPGGTGGAESAGHC